MANFPAKNRGGQGVIAIKVNGRNGRVVGAKEVDSDDELMLITGGGHLVRIRAGEIPTVGRNTQGVRLIRLGDQEGLVSLGKVVEAVGGGAEDDEFSETVKNGANDGVDEA